MPPEVGRLRILEDTPIRSTLQEQELSVDQVVRVEALVVDRDLLHLFLIKVELDCLLRVEHFVADGARVLLLEPSIDALLMVDVEAAEHAAHGLVLDLLHANDTFADHVLAILHSNKRDLDVFV